MEDAKVLYTKLDGERKILRVDSDGNIEYSLDGGETWTATTASAGETKWK